MADVALDLLLSAGADPRVGASGKPGSHWSSKTFKRPWFLCSLHSSRRHSWQQSSPLPSSSLLLRLFVISPSIFSSKFLLRLRVYLSSRVTYFDFDFFSVLPSRALIALVRPNPLKSEIRSSKFGFFFKNEIYFSDFILEKNILSCGRMMVYAELRFVSPPRVAAHAVFVLRSEAWSRCWTMFTNTQQRNHVRYKNLNLKEFPFNNHRDIVA